MIKGKVFAQVFLRYLKENNLRYRYINGVLDKLTNAIPLYHDFGTDMRCNTFSEYVKETTSNQELVFEVINYTLAWHLTKEGTQFWYKEYEKCSDFLTKADLILKEG